jgi:hypothetical protein
MVRKVASATLISLVIIFVLVVVALPWLRNNFGQYFPEGFQDRPDCQGMTCREGQFCQQNKCQDISPPSTIDYTGA